MMPKNIKNKTNDFGDNYIDDDSAEPVELTKIEEAANMMIYVSSYNAAAKIMTAFDETLETLLGIV